MSFRFCIWVLCWAKWTPHWHCCSVRGDNYNFTTFNIGISESGLLANLEFVSSSLCLYGTLQYDTTKQYTSYLYYKPGPCLSSNSKDTLYKMMSSSFHLDSYLIFPRAEPSKLHVNRYCACCTSVWFVYLTPQCNNNGTKVVLWPDEYFTQDTEGTVFSIGHWNKERRRGA